MHKQYNFFSLGLGGLALFALLHWLFGCSWTQILHLYCIWLPILVSAQTLYGTLITTFRLENETEPPVRMVVKNLTLAISLLLVAQSSAWNRYGWFNTGTDYLKLWAHLSFVTVMVIGWQLGCLLSPNRRFRALGRLLGVGVAAGAGQLVLHLQRMGPQALQPGWFLELVGALVFCFIMLQGTFQLKKEDTASSAAAELLCHKGLFLSLFVVYTWAFPTLRVWAHPFLTTLPLGIIATSLLASAGIIWSRSR